MGGKGKIYRGEVNLWVREFPTLTRRMRPTNIYEVTLRLYCSLTCISMQVPCCPLVPRLLSSVLELTDLK